MNDKQRHADEIVARSAGRRTGPHCFAGRLDLPDSWPPGPSDGGYVDWDTDEECACLDGRFTAEILIAIGNHMLANMKRNGEGR